MQQLALIGLISVLCYLVIPGIGAVVIRRNRRAFRRRVVQAAGLEPLSAHVSGRIGVPIERLGVFRFAGSLEAIQGQDTVWLRSPALSVAVRMDGERVHMVPSEGEVTQDGPNAAGAPEYPLLALRWRKLHAIAEGTGFCVAGPAYHEHGKLVFKGEAAEPLLVLVYDGDPDSVFERALWYGRRRNEYWNPLTPPSLVLGAVLLGWVAYGLLNSPFHRGFAVFGITLAALPVLPLLPPGVLFLLLYHKLWKRGRRKRAERDLLLFRDPSRAENALSRGREALVLECFALTALLSGLAINAYLILNALARILL